MAGLKIFDAFVDVTADGTKAARQAANDFRSSPDADNAGKDFGDALTGGLIAGLGAAAIGSVISEAMTQEMSGARLSSALDLTAQESARYGKLAGDLYSQNYGESIDGLNGSIEAVVSSIGGMRDASDEEVGGMVAKLETLSSVFEVDVGRSAQVAGQMISTGMATDGANAADLLTAALQRVPKELRGDLLDAVDEYGPAFQAVGIGGEQAMSMLVDASSKGMYGIDKTGDALKEFGIRATDMSTASKVAYDIMGKDQEDYTKRLLAGGDTAAGAFRELVDGVSSIKDPAKQSQAALALFGTPLEDLNVTEIPAFLEGLKGSSGALGEVAGSAEEMTDKMGGGAASALQGVLRPLQQMGTEVATKLLPPLADFLGWLVETPGAMTAVAAVLAILALAVTTAAVAQWALNAAFLANPITWIIIAIVALVAAIILLVANWDTVVAWISDVWGGFVSWITESLGAFGAAWASEWQSLVDQWNALWDAVFTWISDTWNGFVSWIVESATAFGAAWASEWQSLVDQWNALWSGVFTWISDVWNGFVSWITSSMAAFGAAWASAWQGLVDQWNALWAAVGAYLAQWGANIVAIVSGIVNGIVGFFTGLGAWVTGMWSAMWTWVGMLVSATWAVITGAVSGGVAWVMGLISGFVGTVRGVWGAVWNWVSSMLGGVWSGIVGSVSAGISGVMGFIRGLQGQVMGALSGAGSWLLGIGRSIIDGLVNGIRGAIGRVKDILGSVTSMIPDWKGPAELDAVLLTPNGRLIMDGLVDGIEDGEDPLRRTLGRITTDVPDFVPDFAAMPPAPRGGSSRASGDFAGTSAATGGDTYITVERIEIRAEDVAEFNDIVEMLGDLDQAARTGAVVTK